MDISSQSLDARIGREGAFAQFPNTTEGIAALAAFCHAHQVERGGLRGEGAWPDRLQYSVSDAG